MSDDIEDGPQNDKGYLALGELLDLLRPDFPDLTVSKIRFLEQQGLLAPERTPSGYRKFFPSHAARLRWILAQQEGTYLPLREIKTRLSTAESQGLFEADDRLSPTPSERLPEIANIMRPSISRRLNASDLRTVRRNDPTGERLDGTDSADGAERGDDVREGDLRGAPAASLGERRHPAGLARRAATAFASMTPPEGSEAHPSLRPSASTIARAEAGVPYRDGGPSSSSKPGDDEDVPFDLDANVGVHEQDQNERDGHDGSDGHDRKEPRRPTLRSVPAGPNLATKGSQEPEPNRSPLGTSARRFTFQELAVAASMTPEELREIEQYGLIIGRPVAGVVYYDDDALGAARVAKSFHKFGVEPRHLRIFRTAVDREADFYAQVVSPLVYRREEHSRQLALNNLAELQELGSQLREAALRQVLRTTFDIG